MISILLAFTVNIIGPMPLCQADEFHLPAPGTMVQLSPDYNPPTLKGIKVNPNNPFKFEFILDPGDRYPHTKFSDRHPNAQFSDRHPEQREGSQQEQLKQEATKLIKYFLASLTIPEQDLWVNLSPYEKTRIIPKSFGMTEMGRDLLAEDYMLKQITASLIYPEGEVGKKFWKRVYEEAAKRYGTTNIPVNTFNKVWIVPDKAVIFENQKAGAAYVIESKLKVMLEQDYLSLEKHTDKYMSFPNASVGNLDPRQKYSGVTGVSNLGSQVVREIVIPELTREVNEGKNFTQLRQVYNSLILAAWYKKKIKDSILEQVYADKNKVKGLSFRNDRNMSSSNEKNLSSPNVLVGDPAYIYQQYLKAFKRGAFNYIKEDLDPITQQPIPRKYFSGGASLIRIDNRLKEITNPAMVGNANEWVKRSKAGLIRLAVSLADLIKVADKSRYQLSSPKSSLNQVLTLMNPERIDSEYKRYHDLNVAPFMQESKKEPLENIIEDMAKKETLEGTIYQLTAKDSQIIRALQNPVIDSFDFEIFVGRIRGTSHWIFIKGIEGNAIGERLTRFYPTGIPYDIFDVLIHSHNAEDVFPVPSLGDLKIDSNLQLQRTKLYIRGKNGLTFFTGHHLTETEFNLVDNREIKDYFVSIENDLQRVAAMELGREPKEIRAVVYASLRNHYLAAWDQFLKDKRIVMDFLPWQDIRFAKPASLQLSQQLQTSNTDERLGALYRIFDLIRTNYLFRNDEIWQNLVAVLLEFKDDPDERIQMAVLDWIIEYGKKYGINVKLAANDFQQSRFPIIQAFAAAVAKNDGGGIRLLNDSEFNQQLEQESSINNLELYRLKRLFINMNSFSSMIFAATRISRSLAKKAGRPLLGVFLTRLEADPAFSEASEIFRQRWGFNINKTKSTGNEMDRAMFLGETSNNGEQSGGRLLDHNEEVRIKEENYLENKDIEEILNIDKQGFSKNFRISREDLLRRMQESKNKLILVRQKGLIIGFAILEPAREGQATHLYKIAIDQDRRRLRLGEKLLDEVINNVRHTGESIITFVPYTNQSLEWFIKYSKSHGFKAKPQSSITWQIEIKKQTVLTSNAQIVKQKSRHDHAMNLINEDKMREGMLQEGPMPRISFPSLDSVNEIFSRILKGEFITDAELEIIIHHTVAEDRDWLIEGLKSNWGVGGRPGQPYNDNRLYLNGVDIAGFCVISMADIYKRLKSFSTGQIEINKLNTKDSFGSKVFHGFLIVNLKGSSKKFIVDNTIRQFFYEPVERRRELSVRFVGTYLEKMAPQITHDLLVNGFAEINDDFLNIYARAFGRDSNSLEENFTLQNVLEKASKANYLEDLTKELQVLFEKFGINVGAPLKALQSPSSAMLSLEFMATSDNGRIVRVEKLLIKAGINEKQPWIIHSLLKGELSLPYALENLEHADGNILKAALLSSKYNLSEETFNEIYVALNMNYLEISELKDADTSQAFDIHKRFQFLKDFRALQQIEISPKDTSSAMIHSNRGGIDLTRAGMNVQVRTGFPTNTFGNDSDGSAFGNDKRGIKFHLSPAMLTEFQNSMGFVPVVTSMQPLGSLTDFLEIPKNNK